MPLITQVSARKERRKLERKKRKRQSLSQNSSHNDTETTNVSSKTAEIAHEETPAKKLKEKASNASDTSKRDRKRIGSKPDRYSHLDPSVVEAMQREDAEIASLGAKLGLRKGKASKEKLNKEYAKLEGYGDDFGDFLDDLDGMVERVSGIAKSSSDEENASDGSNSEEISDDEQPSDVPELRYDNMNPDVAAAVRRDDEEIADLGRKLGIGKDKSKLHKAYKVEGYGDDFGDFLSGLDDMVARVKDDRRTAEYEKRLAKASKTKKLNSDDDDTDESDEEVVPMKDPAYDEIDEDDSVLQELEMEEYESESDDVAEDADERNDSRSVSSSEDSDHSEDDRPKEEADHDVSDTYAPSKGEDIYGNKIDSDNMGDPKPTKYVPPHLRKEAGGDNMDEEKLRLIRRALNNALNRLSDDTLVSVAQQLAQVYSSHPTQMVHEMLWKNTKDACILTPILMKGMIPVYIACIVGAHIQTGDTVQVCEYILEAVVTELWSELESCRSGRTTNSNGLEIPEEIARKYICNRILILCYLYNYNIVHCSFMYDMIRHLIEKFSEVDIECLLLLLSHCGLSLRSDDPLALKEIVLLVQKKYSQVGSKDTSSRAEYMLSAITDLKNNKRRKQDTAVAEKTTKLRKSLGQIKSAAAKSNNAKTTSESSLRISLKDILNAESMGRWWKVGASWVGNQYRYTDESSPASSGDAENATGEVSAQQSMHDSEQDEELLRLASKFRMNTDRKRAIFCIIMGSEDCEDAFEKLCRNSMLQNRSERDTCRVLFECSLNEKVYNKFYGHLAARMCEFQPQCKFSLQLAFWDMFKQFADMDARKAANLAKFLFDLVVTHHLLRLMTVIKALDISEDDMESSAAIFLTLLMTSILNKFTDSEPIRAMFAARNAADDDPSRFEQEEGTRASLLVFFMETLKASPQNVKGTQFRKNFKAAIKALDKDGFEDMF